MDRGLIFPGQVPLETDLLFAQKSAMVGLAKLAAAMFGANTIANGMSVVPNSPAALNVLVNPGEIYALSNIDGTAYSSIAADTTHQIVKQGISLDQVMLSCAAPGTAGFSINYLIQATFSEVDGTSVVLPYYNASNPNTAYSGPNNTGTAQNTRRSGTVVLSAKAGTAATTGTQTTPAADAGYVGIAVVTVANGQTTITSGNITALSTASMPAAGMLVGGIQNAAPITSAAGGTADALTGSYAPAIAALTNGMTLYVRAATANATATPTFTPNSGTIAAKTIVKGNGQALIAGDIAGAGHWIELQYDLALDKWVLLNPASAMLGVGVTQPQNDNSTKLATTAYADRAASAVASALAITLGTEQATTSGTSKTFTGIPANAKRVNVLFDQVSTSGADDLLIQLGTSGGIETTGYVGASVFSLNGSGNVGVTQNTGFPVYIDSAANIVTGRVSIDLMNASNKWCASGSLVYTNSAAAGSMGGSKTLAGALTQLTITTLGGTDTFDLGSVNVTYEV